MQHLALLKPRALPQLMLILGLAWMLLCSSRNSFAARGQDRLRSLRKRDGLDIHTKASHKNSVLSKAGKDLLEDIQQAREAGDWMKVRSLFLDITLSFCTSVYCCLKTSFDCTLVFRAIERFASYDDTEIQVYNAVLHAAVNCVQYKAGAEIYHKLCEQQITKTSATYSAALKIFAKLGQNETVRELWEEAKTNPMCEINEPLAAARIDAAAEEGDFESALVVLNEMNQTKVSINIAHITSAIRACWEAGGISYKTAERLLNLCPVLGLEPNIVTFTCLVGASGPIWKVASAA